MFVYPQNSYVEIVTPNMVGFVLLKDEIRVLASSLCPLPHEGTRRPHLWTRRWPFTETQPSVLRLLASRMKNECLLWKPPRLVAWADSHNFHSLHFLWDTFSADTSHPRFIKFLFSVSLALRCQYYGQKKHLSRRWTGSLYCLHQWLGPHVKSLSMRGHWLPTQGWGLQTASLPPWVTTASCLPKGTAGWEHLLTHTFPSNLPPCQSAATSALCEIYIQKLVGRSQQFLVKRRRQAPGSCCLSSATSDPGKLHDLSVPSSLLWRTLMFRKMHSGLLTVNLEETILS